jgi:hypothetical protein
MSMDTIGKPYIIHNEKAEGKSLLPLKKEDVLFKENWLQELLFKHPDILPVNLLDEKFYPPISLGREIANIDNLFISTKGQLIIVETKLWRNPEAHRTVVAQVLDYARTLAKWSYKDLDSAIKSFTLKQQNLSKNIFEIVKENSKYFDYNEIEFQAKVQDNLTNGNFALLIVGDQIHPSVTQLADTIQSAPHLQFTLGFVELNCFKLERDSDWPLIVYPNLVLKTKQVTRAIVKVLYEQDKPEVYVSTPLEDQDSEIKQWDPVSWYDELEKRQGLDEVEIVKKFEEEVKDKPFRFAWSSARKNFRATFWVHLDHDDISCRLFGFRVDGKIEIRFGDIKKFPPFDLDSNRREIAKRLNKIRNLNIPSERTRAGFPTIPILALKNEKSLNHFLNVIDWCTTEIIEATET